MHHQRHLRRDWMQHRLRAHQRRLHVICLYVLCTPVLTNNVFWAINADIHRSRRRSRRVARQLRTRSTARRSPGPTRTDRSATTASATPAAACTSMSSRAMARPATSTTERSVSFRNLSYSSAHTDSSRLQSQATACGVDINTLTDCTVAGKVPNSSGQTCTTNGTCAATGCNTGYTLTNGACALGPFTATVSIFQSGRARSQSWRD